MKKNKHYSLRYGINIKKMMLKSITFHSKINVLILQTLFWLLYLDYLKIYNIFIFNVCYSILLIN